MQQFNSIVWVFSAFVLLTIATFTYSVKIDGSDIDVILNDPTERAKYINCLKGVSECTEDGKKLKVAFREVIKTNSTSLDDAKLAARKILDYLLGEFPDDVRNYVEELKQQNLWDRLKGIVRKPLNWLQEQSQPVTTVQPSTYKDVVPIIVSFPANKRDTTWRYNNRV